MATLIFKSKEEFSNFVNEENKAVTGNVTDDTATAPVSLTQEQIRKNSNAFISSYLAEQRKQILAARKPQPQKAQPKNAHGRRTVRCVECKHLSKDRQCTVNGWEPTRPEGTRLCWNYAPLLG